MLPDRKTSRTLRSSLIALPALLFLAVGCVFLAVGCATPSLPAEAPPEPQLATVVDEDYSDDYADGWLDRAPLIEEEIGADDSPEPR